ncbi:GntR family transcriptional regulator [Pseudomonas aeruginosa]|nr:GntR family transcriptional regulator [Pseudomonas aeruginosa]
MPVDQSRQYLRIRDQLAADIAQGVLQVKLPSERELAERFLCTRITLREALQQLETEGLVYRENRRGWFVAPPRIRYNPTRTTGFMEYVSAQGRQPRTETLPAAPRAAGAALAAKLKGSDAVAVAFFGDGGSNEGAVFEAMNLAAVWNLPCLFVAENNGYAEATAANWSVACDHIADRAAGFGMPGVTVDGFDFFAVHEAAGAAIERARAGEGPSLIEVKLTRYYGHFEGDAQTYRDPDEVKHYRETRDCLKQFRERTCHAGLLSASDLDAIDAEVEARIEDAVQRAKNDPKPEPDDLLRDVYVSYP